MDRTAPGVRIVAMREVKGTAGERVSSLDGRVESFSYEDSEKKADKVTLTVRNDDLALLDDPDLMGGVVLEVSWGYPGHMAPPRRAVIKTIKGFAKLTIEAMATSVLAAREQKARNWTGRTRSAVVRDVARAMGYEGESARIEDTTEVVDTINQLGETDAHLLRRLAVEEGFVFYVDDTGLHWHNRKLSGAPTRVFTYHTDPGRGDVLSVNVESDLTRRVGKTTVKGRDPETKQDISVDATAGTVERDTLADVIEVVDPLSGRTFFKDPRTGEPPVFTAEDTEISYLEDRNATSTVHPTAAATPTAAKGEAGARFKTAEGGTVKLTLEVVGDPSIRAKEVVEVRGISRMLSGKYYLSDVTHTIDGSGYKCELKCKRDGKSAVARKAGEGKGAEQGGTKNTAAKTPAGVLSEIEMVDPDSGRTELVYLQDGVPTWRVEDDQSTLE